MVIHLMGMGPDHVCYLLCLLLEDPSTPKVRRTQILFFAYEKSPFFLSGHASIDPHFGLLGRAYA